MSLVLNCDWMTLFLYSVALITHYQKHLQELSGTSVAQFRDELNLFFGINYISVRACRHFIERKGKFHHILSA